MFWAVVIATEIPGALGPFRNYAKACGVADNWNATHDTEVDGYAWVVRMERSADDLPNP